MKEFSGILRNWRFKRRLCRDPQEQEKALEKGKQLRESGNAREALELLEHVLKARKKTKGSDHADTIVAQGQLARTYLALGDSVSAAELFKKSVKVRQKKHGPFHPLTLNATALWAEALSKTEDVSPEEIPWGSLLEGLVNAALACPDELRLLQNDFIRIASEHLDSLDSENDKLFALALLELARAERGGGNIRAVVDEVRDLAKKLGYHRLHKHLAGGEGVFRQGPLIPEPPDKLSLTGRDVSSISEEISPTEEPDDDFVFARGEPKVKRNPPDELRIEPPVDGLSIAEENKYRPQSTGDEASMTGDTGDETSMRRREKIERDPPSDVEKEVERFKSLSNEERIISLQEGEHAKKKPGAGISVDCTVFGPPGVAPGRTVMIQVFAHEPIRGFEALKNATEFDSEAIRRAFTGLKVPLFRGNRITFHLEVPGLTVEDPVQVLTWSGRTESVQFSVSAPSDAQIGGYIGKVTVSLEGIPEGHIRFRIDVSGIAAEKKPRALGDDARHYRRAFVSYSSKDRSEVLKRIQMLTLLDIDIFQDLLHLSPGERWVRKLYDQIDKCDLFLLFWSHAARESRYVREELRYAMQCKGNDETNPPEILPVVLGPPPPAKPPEELDHLHFNDYLIYLLEGMRGAGA